MKNSVFNESTPSKNVPEIVTDSDTQPELKSCLRNKGKSFANNMLNDDTEFGDDFHNLKLTSFYNLQHNLSRSENLVITMNAEYISTGASQNAANLLNQQPAYSLLSGSSTNNSTASGLNNIQSTTYNRIPSFSSSINATGNPSSASSKHKYYLLNNAYYSFETIKC